MDRERIPLGEHVNVRESDVRIGKMRKIRYLREAGVKFGVIGHLVLKR